MKVYVGKNKKGMWKASLDESKLSKFSNVFESDVETVHNNKVYMIQTYYGFDYGMSSMFDVVQVVPQAFHSVLAAKKHEVWSERAKTAKDSPDEFVVTDFSIASNVYGEPFSFGDVMEGNFNMKIIGIKVI